MERAKIFSLYSGPPFVRGPLTPLTDHRLTAQKPKTKITMSGGPPPPMPPGQQQGGPYNDQYPPGMVPPPPPPPSMAPPPGMTLPPVSYSIN